MPTTNTTTIISAESPSVETVANQPDSASVSTKARLSPAVLLWICRSPRAPDLEGLVEAALRQVA